MHSIRLILEAVFALLTLCGIGYYGLCIVGAYAFKRAHRQLSSYSPPVSILKPLRGTDRGMYESFRSHCLQDYPGDYEFIFGVMRADDPAVADVERLRQEFPGKPIQLVICPQVLGTNLKVSNLIQMLPAASYEHILVNDSDIRVPQDYLRRVMSEFADSQVGMVTALYRGHAGRTITSRLESVGISTDFSAGVLAARLIEGGVRFGLGSTLAFTRSALRDIGGFEPLVNYLADDYELGMRIAANGHEVRLANVVVDTFLPDYDLRGFFNHQLRWARSTRDSRPSGYLGVLLTFGLPWALLTAIMARFSGWAILLLACTLVARYALAVGVGSRVVHDDQLRKHWPLIPIRDICALAVWIASVAGHTITWRGDLFVLEKGKLRPIS